MKIEIVLATGHNIKIDNADEIIPTDRTLEIQHPTGMVAIPMTRVLYWRIDV